MDNVKEKMDIFFDKTAPSIVVDVKEYRNGYKRIRKRGGKIRAFTEITRENLPYCKELMNLVDELRHLDGVRGGIAISETEYMATTVLQDSTPLTEVVYSRMREVVEQGQYIFDTLWSTATPAEQKIKELEEGIEHPVIQVITDTRISISLAYDLIDSASHEILILFASARTFLLAVDASSTLSHYQKALQRGINLTILVPMYDDSKKYINTNHDGYANDERERAEGKYNNGFVDLSAEVNRIIEKIPDANLVITDESTNTKITMMVVDNSKSIVWELKDDTLKDPYQAGGIATYSNIPSVASSYASIIHIIRKQLDLYEQLKDSNERLEMLNKQLESHNMIQQEFINIAAHELRTPIQPILGLSEIALARNKKASDDNDPQLKETLEVITRNAKRLHRLTDDILDVTRIDSKILKLNKEPVDIDEVIDNVINDFRNRVNSHGDKQTKPVKITGHLNRSEYVRSPKFSNLICDKNRVIQIISNLVSNAVKFSLENGVITISREVSEDDKSIVISVIDRGTGIDPDILPRLFSKFSTRSN
ncbi:MAG TPA: HAMP domain-containing sensor histidine kinase, partial [Nitrososphaeraceae archaeon]|nr:HAMP domain-containing sensor histidine kinase [Nitrososphaeraceae archaeon]